MTNHGDPESVDFGDEIEERCIGCAAWTPRLCECDEPICDRCEETHTCEMQTSDSRKSWDDQCWQCRGAGRIDHLDNLLCPKCGGSGIA